MRKVANWLLGVFFVVALIDWSIMGIKLLDNNYNITIESYIGFVCFIVIFSCILIRSFTDKCPRCGKVRTSNGAFCSYCGKEVK